MIAPRFTAALAVVTALAGCSTRPAEAPAAPRVPLFDNLGAFHFPVTTTSADAQKYVDQGMRLSYAFNHAEAIRAFREAARLDPACAMCDWGVAYALGPNINAPITEDAAKEAYQAIEQAKTKSEKASDREKAYIGALAKRYAVDPKAERAPLDKAYAEAMRDVVKRFPDDLDAATLFAQSLMDTSPWNYWNLDGTPHSFTPDVLAALESVLKRKPDHLGAIHLYIHAVEASPDPGRAEQYADTLPALAPGAGHLVHMPAHIYLRVGRFNDASAANQTAIKADEAYLAGDAVPGNMTYQLGYYPHNIHFFVTSALMEGRRADAVKAAEEVRHHMPVDMLRDPAAGGMGQHMALAPIFTKVRFGLWNDVLAEADPGEEFPYMRAMWHVARGLAQAAQGRVAEAEKERAALAALKDLPALKTVLISSVNTASAILAIANEVLSAEIAAKRRNAADALRHYAQAVKLEDGLIYMEPPDWPIPVRQLQGASALELGRARDAEAAFRGDLKKFPGNGWSLSGLQASLERQRRTSDAAAVKAEFEKSWSAADTKVAAGRVSN
jgi:tetratricopeptide (TPR) repeat protein